MLKRQTRVSEDGETYPGAVRHPSQEEILFEKEEES